VPEAASPNVERADDLAALIVTTGTDWSKELGALSSRQERQQRRAELMSEQELALLKQLAGLPVALERLEALGSWTVRGAKSVLAQVRAPGGPLADSGFEVVPDATFHTL